MTQQSTDSFVSVAHRRALPLQQECSHAQQGYISDGVAINAHRDFDTGHILNIEALMPT